MCHLFTKSSLRSCCNAVGISYIIVCDREQWLRTLVVDVEGFLKHSVCEVASVLQMALLGRYTLGGTADKLFTLGGTCCDYLLAFRTFSQQCRNIEYLNLNGCKKIEDL